MQFTTNVGAKDRMARIGVGVVLMLLGLAGTLGTWAVVIGLIVAGTGFMRFCPAYKLLGMNTCETQ